MDATNNLKRLRVGDRVTMRYPNGMLQEAILVSNDDGMLNFHVGEIVGDFVGPIVEIFVNGAGKWSVGPQ